MDFSKLVIYKMEPVRRIILDTGYLMDFLSSSVGVLGADRAVISTFSNFYHYFLRQAVCKYRMGEWGRCVCR